MWTLEDALDVIKILQPKLREINYHVTLGGGVLNNGSSPNDLDLYFLPLEDESNHPDDRKHPQYQSVMETLHHQFGITGNYMEDYENLRTSYKVKLTYHLKSGRKVDAFIL